MELGNIQFAWPWLLLCLPLPLLLRFFLPAREQQQDAALQVPFLQNFSQTTASQQPHKTKLLSGILAALAWCCLILAASRPQWLGDTVDIPISGRDLMMAVDLSGSMAAEDFDLNGRVINRLQAVKLVAGEFIKRRDGDRIGLILFGQQAYLQTPLTFDTKTVNIMLQESLIGIAGKATAIGDAIGLALKRLQTNEVSDKNSNRNKTDDSFIELAEKNKSRVLILLTDGANTAGEVSPLKAAELAAKQSLKIYTIGVGAETREMGGLFFKRRIKNTEIDEKTLRQIAEMTGGKYFRARNTSELNEIYNLLDELEPVEQESQSFRPITALFMWPLSLFLVLSGLLFIQPVTAHLWLKIKGLLSIASIQTGKQ